MNDGSQKEVIELGLTPVTACASLSKANQRVKIVPGSVDENVPRRKYNWGDSINDHVIHVNDDSKTR